MRLRGWHPSVYGGHRYYFNPRTRMTLEKAKESIDSVEIDMEGCGVTDKIEVTAYTLNPHLHTSLEIASTWRFLTTPPVWEGITCDYEWDIDEWDTDTPYYIDAQILNKDGFQKSPYVWAAEPVIYSADDIESEEEMDAPDAAVSNSDSSSDSDELGDGGYLNMYVFEVTRPLKAVFFGIPDSKLETFPFFDDNKLISFINSNDAVDAAVRFVFDLESGLEYVEIAIKRHVDGIQFLQNITMPECEKNCDPKLNPVPQFLRSQIVSGEPSFDPDFVIPVGTLLLHAPNQQTPAHPSMFGRGSPNQVTWFGFRPTECFSVRTSYAGENLLLLLA